jgi:hypothetical protein
VLSPAATDHKYAHAPGAYPETEPPLDPPPDLALTGGAGGAEKLTQLGAFPEVSFAAVTCRVPVSSM